MHIGTLRTALYNYFVARQNNGEFLVRIEDTDQKRFVEGSIENLLSVFETMKLDYDEGPFMENGTHVEKGDHGPYIQSERREIYDKYIQLLLKNNHAYHCFCSAERLQEMREQKRATKQTPKYDRHCLNLNETDVSTRIQNGDPFVIRMKIPEGKTEVDDLIRGKVIFDNAEIDDQVLIKSDGLPLYHFAVVVDDHLMNISHVIRGEEWLSSTPKHVILHNMLGFQLPIFAHVPLLLNADKTKLSKRQGDVAVEDYLKKGYLPDALINFVATLGFNPKSDQEIYSRDELIELFDLKKVNKSGAVMNQEKLDWMNAHYIKAMSDEDYKRAASVFVSDKLEGMNWRAALVEKQRIQRLDELEERIAQYEKYPEYDAPILVWKKSDKEDCIKQLTHILPVIESIRDESLKEIETKVKEYIADNELKNGNVLWPLRVALSGSERSPSPFELLWTLGEGESVHRIKMALSKLA